MKSKRKTPHKLSYEFVLLIVKKYSEQTKRIVNFIGLRTVDEFSNFRYEIVVEDNFMNNVLRLDILGLRTPPQNMPSFGPAVFKKEYPITRQIKEIIVSKKDGDENSFLVDLTGDTAVILKSPKDKFVEIVTAEKDWMNNVS